MVECHLAKVKVAGPNPVSRSNRNGSPLHKVSDDDRKIAYSSRYAPLAQLVEQLTLNQWVPGSNP